MTTYDIQYRRSQADGFRHLRKSFQTVSEAEHYMGEHVRGHSKRYPDASIVAIVDGKYASQPGPGERELAGAEITELQKWHAGGHSGAIDMAPFTAASAEEAILQEGWRNGTIPVPTAG